MFSVFALLGIIGYRNLGYELLPDFNQPVIVIKTVYPGAEPEEIESSLTRRMEDALSNLEGVDYLESRSMPNASVIVANLKYGTDVDQAMQDAQRYIDNIRSELPEDVQSPVMSKVSPNDLPIISVSATSTMEPTVFYQNMLDDYLPRIQQLKGVAEITLLGGEQREIQVKLDQEKLKHYRIPVNQVVEAINRSGIDLPSGKVESEGNNTPVRLTGKYTDPEEILDVQVAMPVPGSPVYVKDVAELTDGLKEITSVSRYNGQDGIGLLIKKQGDANAVEVSALVREELKAIEQEQMEQGVRFIIADDSTENTLAAVDSVVYDLILAVILVSLVMLLFLRSYRNAFIVLISIPTSLITAFAVMWLLGYTLNLMTLLAMSLIIGILVDDAIVVLENIQRHLDMGKEKRNAAMDGRMEIGFSALSITLVDVVVFLPILFLQVFIADMLSQFAVVVVTSTLTSLLVGFTLTPWLASRIGKREDLQPKGLINRFLLWFEQQLQSFIQWYGKALEWVLAHKLIFTGMVLLMLVSTALMMQLGIIGKEMMATGDQGKFRLNLEFDKSMTVRQNNLISSQVENYIIAQNEVATLFSNIAGPSTGIGSLGVGSANKSEFTIQLKPEEERAVSTEEFMRALRMNLEEEFAGINFSMAFIGLLPKSAPIKITLSGQDMGMVMETAGGLQDVLRTLPGADNVQLSVVEGNPEYKVIPDKDKMQRYGLSTAYLGQHLRTAFSGNEDASVTEKGTEYPVRIWLDDIDRRNYEDVRSLWVINPQGVPVSVHQFAEVVQDKSPSLLERLDRQSSVTLTAESFGRPSGTLADDVLAYLDSNPLPQGVQLTWGADIKTQNESFGALGSVLLISFILIYLIMVALYDSFIYPFVALFGIPVAAIGAFFALNLSGSDITLFALLGLIMLMGLVTKNAILIVDFTNQLKQEGYHFKEALIIAGKERMRPILMTTLAMAIGMLPIALAQGTASEWKNGLAWVIIGGLISSLILTVFLVPMVYNWVDSIKEKLDSRIRKAATVPSAQVG
jgi:HAE1 family hydrophobic/amphiphilic exporter-1